MATPTYFHWLGGDTDPCKIACLQDNRCQRNKPFKMGQSQDSSRQEVMSSSISNRKDHKYMLFHFSTSPLLHFSTSCCRLRGKGSLMGFEPKRGENPTVLKSSELTTKPQKDMREGRHSGYFIFVKHCPLLFFQ